MEVFGQKGLKVNGGFRGFKFGREKWENDIFIGLGLVVNYAHNT